MWKSKIRSDEGPGSFFVSRAKDKFQADRFNAFVPYVFDVNVTPDGARHTYQVTLHKINAQSLKPGLVRECNRD